MASQPPPIDARTQAELVAQTEAALVAATGTAAATAAALVGRILAEPILAEDGGEPLYPAGMAVGPAEAEEIARILGSEARVRVLPWAPGTEPDPLGALVRVFARFCGHVVERLNRAPEKQRLAFFDLAGARLRPPAAAHTPVVFALVEGHVGAAAVPAGTEVGADLVEGEVDEVTFETTRDLTVLGARLIAARTTEPGEDRIADGTGVATGASAGDLIAFKGLGLVERALYVAQASLFSLEGPEWIELEVESPDAAVLPLLPLVWSHRAEGQWIPLGRSGTILSGYVVRSTEERGLEITPGRAIDGLGRAIPMDQPRTLEIPPGLRGQVAVVLLSPGFDFVPTLELIEERASWAYPATTHLRLGRLAIDEEGGAAETVRARIEGLQPLSVGQPGASRWIVRIERPPTITPSVVEGDERRWLRLVHDAPRPKGSPDLPTAVGIRVRARTAAAGIPPTAALRGAEVLDTSRGFTPLGGDPQVGDTFTLLSSEVFGKPAGTRATATLELGEHLLTTGVFTSPQLTLLWEAWTRGGWVEVGRSGPGAGGAGIGVEDLSHALSFHPDPGRAVPAAAQATLSLTLPAGLAELEVGGERGHALRARLLQGDYGRPAGADPVKLSSSSAAAPNSSLIDEDGDPIVLVWRTSTLAPPALKSLSLGYQLEAAQLPPDRVLEVGDFRAVDRTQATLSGEGFTPFSPPAERDPALYLGFAPPLPNRTLSLFIELRPPSPEEVGLDATPQARGIPGRPSLSWEYRSALGWRRLEVEDDTRALTRSGRLAFLLPADLTPAAELGSVALWVRARWSAGTYRALPRIGRILPDAVMARHAVEIQGEILGSGTGEPGQRFTLSRTPVLEGAAIEVHESGGPAQGSAPASDSAGWIRWEPVTDFLTSGPSDRHYTLDHSTGALAFGDGLRGMAPPPGVNSVMAARYLSGGGLRGNRAPATITDLKTTLPFIASAVNPLAASGGAEGEALPSLAKRAPQGLRHRGRAMAAVDFEDLARERFPAVARALMIAPHFDPVEQAGAPRPPEDSAQLSLIVVPYGRERRPTPSLALIEEIEEALGALCPPAARLRCAGAEWVEIQVQATLVPASLVGADALPLRVAAALEAFLHPLTGGPDGGGWAFGRMPRASDFYRLIGSMAGVDHVRSLAVIRRDAPTQGPDESRRLERSLVSSADHQILLEG